MRKQMIFLGGSCDPTTWRTDIAIPMLTRAGVEFFNPQVAEWTQECVAREASAKADSDVLLFVLDGQTRARGTRGACSARRTG